MAIKKSQLYNTLWEACNALRGGMDASQYKDYVLVVLFLKYISDKSKSSDMLIPVPKGCSFNDVIQFANRREIGEKMNTSLAKIAEAYEDSNLKGVITAADFTDEQKLGKGKDLIDTVSQLLKVFQNENLDFSNNRAADDDLIGDAYEYLMRQFASQSGKSKGQFYTPAEVSRVMASVIGIAQDKRKAILSIYDPTSGSGSLLLRAKSEAHRDVSLDGQEKELATIGMAKMSMIIHGDEFACLKHGDTLNAPMHKVGDQLQQFDYIVSNPPFSLKNWMKSAKAEDDFGRWGTSEGRAPVPPQSCGDYAFLLHIVASLKPDGRAACILPHGVLFRGNEEAKIREWLVRRHYISGIIGLPANLFYGTGIPACIIIVDKRGAAESKGVFMIDAKDGFEKDGNKNRLREMDIRRIVDTWNAREDIPHYSRFVPFEEIQNSKNNFNLNLPRYVAPEDKEIQQDITAHLYGDIPAHDVEESLAHYWESCPSLKEELFKHRKSGYYSLQKKGDDDIRNTVERNTDFLRYTEKYKQSLKRFFDAVTPQMKKLENGFDPKKKIAEWGKSLFDEVNKQQLVNPYQVYEILMNYWAETMQDDCYLISRGGWNVSVNIAKKKPTYRDIDCDLVPVEVLVKEFFADEEAAIISQEARVEEKIQAKEEFEEENSADLEDDEQNIVLKSIKKKAESADIDKQTKKILSQYISLNAELSKLKAELKSMMATLLENVKAKYNSLTEKDVRHLVVDCKWRGVLESRSNTLLTEVCQQMTTDIVALRDRYANTLPSIEARVNDLREKVNESLAAMGIKL